MNVKQMFDSMSIFGKYAPEAHFEANHDIIYGPGLDELGELTTNDKDSLEELGWFIDEDNNCWSCFV